MNKIIKIKGVKSKQLVVQISEPVLDVGHWHLAKILLIITDFKAKTEFTFMYYLFLIAKWIPSNLKGKIILMFFCF